MDALSPEQLVPFIHNVRYWRHKEQFLMETDSHHAWMMFAVESGSFRYEIDGEEGTAERGDLVFCPPFTTFRRVIVKPLTFFVFNFSLHAGERDDSAGQSPDVWAGDKGRSGLPSGKVTIRDVQRLASDFDYLRSVWELDEEPYASRKQYLLLDIWRLYGWETDANRRFASVREDPLMERAELLIRERAHVPFSMKELAGELGLSPVQLTRRFTSAYGKTPGAYGAALRLNKARALLVETDWTLDDIARRCGYDNGFYFSRAFSAKMGMPPSHYRESNRL
ncbi:helix-turn-helix transcriptional regulator [Paenibacillus mesophilus]|uniref:helix-turn-helix domain-containing protein n=1 Tax=Paenibacillus mesophilus TaxID=2582849 RepID=UPI00110DB6DF|nr:AraC family transcriptional regulator [Paenibacillus mesophilus]TMV46434.1 helix-turn-helix transcriptional regulator [Paenibacillus mesophilus]